MRSGTVKYLFTGVCPNLAAYNKCVCALWTNVPKVTAYSGSWILRP